MNSSTSKDRLFDPDRLAEQLDQSKRIIPVLKDTLLTLHAHLDEQFYAGADIDDLIYKRSDYMDQILKLVWQRFDWNENLHSWRKTRVALIAVGGYGRGELHPQSDIDLLILLERNSYDLHKQSIQSFLTLMWDIGLDVGHSVRSLNECQIQARADITVATTLMESRTIIGDDALRQKMIQKTGPAKIWPSNRFFKAKWDEQKERHRKFDDTVYNLEPNVKSSPGGLRDIQTVMWIARRESAAVTLQDLFDQHMLTEPELKQLDDGRKYLWKVRYGLHLLSGRPEDRLSFEYQRKLADLFGYSDNDDLLAVEQFMRDYYRIVLGLQAINKLLLQHFDETILRIGEKINIRPLNSRFQVRNHYIETTHDNVFKEHPPAMLELFVLAGNHEDIKEVSASTIRLITSQLHLINDDFRANPEATKLFIELLRSPHKLFTQLTRMKRYGVLGAYLPEFGHIIGQMQFDMFHIYTVDAHTLQVIRNMRRFRYRNNEQKFPVAAHIIPKLPKIELLYIAGLYHDIAKGRGGDHSYLGVQDVTKFCHLHQLSIWDTNLVRWLVENHLSMSGTAQRKDISDPAIIHEFALLVQDQVRLDYLYALTVADINATNPTLWNSWRASLLRQLYLETKRLLRRGLENYADKSEYIAEAKLTAIERLKQRGVNERDILQLWDDIGEEYFIRESVANIVLQSESILKHRSVHNIDGEPLILVSDYFMRQGEEGATQIFIHCKNRNNLFASSASALDQLGLNVLDARIFTSGSNFVFYTFMVLEADGQLVGDNAVRIERITRLLRDYLKDTQGTVRIARRRTSQQLKQFNIPTEISMSRDATGSYTVLELVTLDRPGLLAIVAQIFVEMDMVLQGAKITTLGERVEDVFNLTDRNNQPITDPALYAQLEERICTELDKNSNDQ
jgi:[protein-PII] uridylyltransferase